MTRKKPSTPDKRRALGRARPDGKAQFPVPPPKSELPASYGETLRELTELIRETRLRTELEGSLPTVEQIEAELMKP